MNMHDAPSSKQIEELSTRELGLALLPWFEHNEKECRPLKDMARWLVEETLQNPKLYEPLSEAIDYLFREGLLVHTLKHGYGESRVLRLSRLGKQVLEATPKEYVFSDTRAAELVHPRLTDALREMDRGFEHYADAQFKAFREVEIAVREASGIEGKVGVELVRAAFAYPGGPLTDPGMLKPEADALAHLFAGAIGYLKNPPSHRRVDEIDGKRTLRLTLFASELLNIVEGYALLRRMMGETVS
jgi:uncharacterized protein (TIGR02391 family)